jgi:hypothetical protein
MINPRGYKKEFLNRKTGGAKYAGVPQVPSNDPKHHNASKDWLDKLMSDIKKVQTQTKS